MKEIETSMDTEESMDRISEVMEGLMELRVLEEQELPSQPEEITQEQINDQVPDTTAFAIANANIDNEIASPEAHYMPHTGTWTNQTEPRITYTQAEATPREPRLTALTGVPGYRPYAQNLTEESEEEVISQNQRREAFAELLGQTDLNPEDIDFTHLREFARRIIRELSNTEENSV